jgi:hypothetical protein
VLNGTAGNDIVNSLADNDSVFVQQGGDDQVNGMEGNDGFYFGSAFTNADGADGGPGTDTLALQGNYPALTLGSGVVNVDVLFLAPGNDARFGDTAGNFYDYNVTTVDPNVAAGAILTVIGGNLRPGEDLAFNGGAETNGHFRIFAGRGVDNLTGGLGNDGFYFGVDGNFTGADRVNGLAGMDTIALRGNYVGGNAVVLQQNGFLNIEVLTFLSGHTNEFGGFIDTNGFDYDFTFANGTMPTGFNLDVIATNLRDNESLRFDGRAEAAGTLRILSGAGEDILFGGAKNDILAGGAGFDVLDGGAGADTYLFTSLEDAPGDQFLADKVELRSGDSDKIDLSMIDAIAGTSANDAFTFIGDAAFTNVAGQLRAFKIGDTNSWSIEADVDGDGVRDLWISAVSDNPITASDFVL